MSQVKSGKHIRKLSHEYGLHENKILDWIRLFNIFGEEVLKKQLNFKASPEFKELLVRLVIEKGSQPPKRYEVIQSMSRKGNCLNNVMEENFFGIMKSELLYAEEFESAKTLIKLLEEYIDYYNNI